jgi:hypothetical protein
MLLAAEVVDQGRFMELAVLAVSIPPPPHLYPATAAADLVGLAAMDLVSVQVPAPRAAGVVVALPFLVFHRRPSHTLEEEAGHFLPVDLILMVRAFMPIQEFLLQTTTVFMFCYVMVA